MPSRVNKFRVVDSIRWQSSSPTSTQPTPPHQRESVTIESIAFRHPVTYVLKKTLPKGRAMQDMPSKPADNDQTAELGQTISAADFERLLAGILQVSALSRQRWQEY